MRVIIMTYGKALAALVTVSMLLVLMFAEVRDDAGNRGILAVTGANIHTGEEERPPEFAAYCAESIKKPPRFVSVNASSYRVPGAYQISDFVTAWDDAGNELFVHVLSVTDEAGNEMENGLMFSKAGIYRICVCAVDDGNRKTECEIKIPINQK